MLQESLPAPMGEWHYITKAGEDTGGLKFIRKGAAGHEQTVLDLTAPQHSHLALGQVRPKHDASLVDMQHLAARMINPAIAQQRPDRRHGCACGMAG